MRIVLAKDRTHFHIPPRYADNVRRFLRVHALGGVEEEATFTIAPSAEKRFQKAILIRWMCRIYAKATLPPPRLEQILIGRLDRRIVLHFPKAAATVTVAWRFSAEEAVRLTLSPYRPAVASEIADCLGVALRRLDPQTLLLDTPPDDPEALHALLATERIAGFRCRHRFDAEALEHFLKTLRAIREAQKTLRLEPTPCDLETLKKRFRRLARRYHPDTLGRDGDDKRAEYTTRMQEINAAYETLRKYLDHDPVNGAIT